MDVLMPQLGETVAEGRITTWFKAVGDAVKPGDNLFEIETDKVSMEVPATAPGVIAEIRVGAGTVAPVGAVVAVISDAAVAVISDAAVAVIAEPGALLAPTTPQAAANAPSVVLFPAGTQPTRLDPFREVRTPERNFGPARLPSGVVVTPLARRLAVERGIDLAAIAGSGPRGRITARDVESVLATHPRPATVAPAPEGTAADRVKALFHDAPFEELSLDGMRATIARRLTAAKQTIPHFYLSADIALDRLLRLREEANAAARKDTEGKPLYRLSLTDFIVKALALALQEVPAANAVFAEDRVLRFKQSDVGIAIAVDGGLLTPVIRHAEQKSLTAISIELRDLSARARKRRLTPRELEGGVTAVSNLGMHGIRDFSAIINPPHATILAVGAGRRQPVERDGGIAFESVMTVTLSCDHRVVDGALGAALLTSFRGFIEQPVTALV
jgi:pyruvate dehydrogenase E2 component (dihydrolipoamide acetyltransferase)